MSTYCTRAQIEAVFGVSEVQKWADLDEDADGDANDADVVARIARAIAVASAEIDDFVRGMPYVTPLADADGNTPTTIENIAATMAGVWLYEARGSQDFSPKSGDPYHRLAFKRTEARRFLQQLREGDRKLDAM